VLTRSATSLARACRIASNTTLWLKVPATKPRSPPPVRTGEKMIVPRSPLWASATEPVAASDPAPSARSIVSRRPGWSRTSTPSRLRPVVAKPASATTT